MKIGDQAINHAKGVARCDEDVGFGGAGTQFSTLRSGFEGAQAGRADGNHTATTRSGTGDGINGSLWDVEAFRVHVVFGEVVYAHRLEGAGADVQGQPGEFGAARV